jgi:hypothetical protein
MLPAQPAAHSSTDLRARLAEPNSVKPATAGQDPVPVRQAYRRVAGSYWEELSVQFVAWPECRHRLHHGAGFGRGGVEGHSAISEMPSGIVSDRLHTRGPQLGEDGLDLAREIDTLVPDTAWVGNLDQVQTLTRRASQHERGVGVLVGQIGGVDSAPKRPVGPPHRT